MESAYFFKKNALELMVSSAMRAILNDHFILTVLPRVVHRLLVLFESLIGPAVRVPGCQQSGCQQSGCQGARIGCSS